MVTLLLRLAGPLQAWGTGSKFETRSTQREPSKSGVIGMISSAMGRSRDNPIDDLTSLKFGVRIDQEGTVLKDYHTASSSISTSTYVTNRYYLENGCFLVGLEGDESKLKEIENALKNPYYPLFLGRRSCPPEGELVLGIRNKNLYEALEDESWLASNWYRRQAPRDVMLEIVHDESHEKSSTFVRDNPVSFSQNRRIYSDRTFRRVLNGKKIENKESKVRLSKNNLFDVMAEVRKEAE